MILDLHRQGLSISAIALRLDLDRKTVRRYIGRGLEPPIYGPRAPRAQKVDPYLDFLRDRLRASSPSTMPANPKATSAIMRAKPARSLAHAGAGDPEVLVDDLHLVTTPAEAHGPLGELVLTSGRLAVVLDLRSIRLAHVDNGRAEQRIEDGARVQKLGPGGYRCRCLTGRCRRACLQVGLCRRNQRVGSIGQHKCQATFAAAVTLAEPLEDRALEG